MLATLITKSESVPIFARTTVDSVLLVVVVPYLPLYLLLNIYQNSSARSRHRELKTGQYQVVYVAEARLWR